MRALNPEMYEVLKDEVKKLIDDPFINLFEVGIKPYTC